MKNVLICGRHAGYQAGIDLSEPRDTDPSEIPDSGSPSSAAASRQLERLVVDFGRIYRERNEALDELVQAHHDALLRLAMAAECIGNGPGDGAGVNIVRIGFMSEALALLLGHSTDAARMLRKAAPLHDIGKIGISDAVHKKPGALSPQERIAMNQHPVLGAELLGRSRLPLFQLAAELALTHHERWDGSGYPGGLRGESIPLAGRIVAVVDVFDALTSDCCYRPAFSDAAALAMLAEQRGLAFDPHIVDVFLAHAEALVAVRERVNLTQPTFHDIVEVD